MPNNSFLGNLNSGLSYLITTVSLVPLGLNAQTEIQILNGLQHMNTILRNFNVLHDLPFWKTVGQYVLLELQTKSIHATYVAVAMHRSPEESTNQAYSSCFYFRIQRILKKQPYCSLSFLQGLRSTNIKQAKLKFFAVLKFLKLYFQYLNN